MDALGIEPFGLLRAGKPNFQDANHIARVRVFKELKDEHTKLADWAANSCVEFARDPANDEYVPRPVTIAYGEKVSSDGEEQGMSVHLCCFWRAWRLIWSGWVAVIEQAQQTAQDNATERGRRRANRSAGQKTAQTPKQTKNATKNAKQQHHHGEGSEIQAGQEPTPTYERQRRDRIAENRTVMRSLGI